VDEEFVRRAMPLLIKLNEDLVRYLPNPPLKKEYLGKTLRELFGREAEKLVDELLGVVNREFPQLLNLIREEAARKGYPELYREALEAVARARNLITELLDTKVESVAEVVREIQHLLYNVLESVIMELARARPRELRLRIISVAVPERVERPVVPIRIEYEGNTPRQAMVEVLENGMVVASLRFETGRGNEVSLVAPLPPKPGVHELEIVVKSGGGRVLYSTRRRVELVERRRVAPRPPPVARPMARERVAPPPREAREAGLRRERRARIGGSIGVIAL